jgi:rare lipoprotein A
MNRITLAALALVAFALLCAPITALAQDNNPFSGARSISVEMTREPAPQICEASHYGHGDGYNGRRTANGERFNTYRDMTAAMKKPQPFNSWVTVTNLANGRSVRVRINDRGPFVAGRCVDLSYLAAGLLGMDGVAEVSVQR